MTEAVTAVRRAAPGKCKGRRAKLAEEIEGLFSARAMRAAEAVQSLRAHVASARKMIENVAERKAAGELDERTAAAELVPPKTVIALAASLQNLTDKAMAAKDSHTLGCLRTAAITLSAHVEAGLLKEGHYPKDPAMAEQFIEQNINFAKSAHSSVLKALGNTFMEYGIGIMPSPPEPMA